MVTKVLKYNVCIESTVGQGGFIQYNLFHHYSFIRDLKENFKKNSGNREEFDDRLKRIIMYYFWSKAEYEIMISTIFSKGPAPKKVDVYDQIMLNWDIFEDYIWNHKSEIKKLKV